MRILNILLFCLFFNISIASVERRHDRLYSFLKNTVPTAFLSPTANTLLDVAYNPTSTSNVSALSMELYSDTLRTIESLLSPLFNSKPLSSKRIQRLISLLPPYLLATTHHDLPTTIRVNRHMNEIVSGLHIGNHSAAGDFDDIQSRSLKCSLEWSKAAPPQYTCPEHVRRAERGSKSTLGLTKYIESVMYIHRSLSSHDNLLAHCESGTSRSPSLVLAYLMLRYNLTLSEALIYSRWRRHVIMPNEIQLEHLEAWEEILHGKVSIVDRNARKKWRTELRRDIHNLGQELDEVVWEMEEQKRLNQIRSEKFAKLSRRHFALKYKIRRFLSIVDPEHLIRI